MTLTPALLAVLATAPYVRAHVSTDPAAHCLWWGEGTITWTQNTAGNPANGSLAFDAVDAAFATWSQALAACSDLGFTQGPRSSSRKVGWESGGAANLNLVLFRYSACSKKVAATSPCWAAGTCGNVYDCWDHGTGLLGVTTLSYSTRTGQIVDADIELDAADNVFTVVNNPVCTIAPALTCVAADVQNTVTHEVGHLLGLAHSPSTTSTMSATSMMGDVAKRRIDTGSAQFLCDAYPRGLSAQDCVAGADGGYGTGGGATQGCAAAPGGLAGLLGWLLLRGRRSRAGLAVAAALTLAGAARATTLLAFDVEALTQVSDVVVRATVVRTQPRWTGDHARIVTDVELEVAEAWKGAPARRLIVTVPGGAVGELGQLVEGVACFVPGEEVVAFLEARGPGFGVTGMAQGKFLVDRGAGGPAASQQAAEGSRFLDPATMQEVAWAPLRVPLSELRARVRAQAR